MLKPDYCAAQLFYLVNFPEALFSITITTEIVMVISARIKDICNTSSVNAELIMTYVAGEVCSTINW